MTTEEKPKRYEDQRGLVCRQCGCDKFNVLYTRRAFGGRLIRRRRCRNCSQRITTYERAIQ